jgi:hypothetical protein
MSKKSKEKEAPFASGAKRSEKLPNTTRIPLGFLQLVARRGDEGELKYGRFNYRKGLLDREFVEQGFAHVLAHLQNVANYYHDHGTFPDGAAAGTPHIDTQGRLYEQYTVPTDDELAGAAWGLMMLWEAREKHRDAVPA